jgi:hypothetical protein
MPLWPARLLRLAALHAALALPACGPKRLAGEVEGSLTQEGNPLAGVMVTFVPDTDQKDRGPSAQGLTDSQGHFKLASVDGRRGVATGRHRVLLRDTLAARPQGRRGGSKEDKQPPPSRIPAKYQNAAQMPLTRDVQAGPQVIPLTVEAP